MGGRALLRATRVLTPDEEFSPGWVLIEGTKIAAAGHSEAPAADTQRDLRDLTLVPGFIDVHVHGGGGHSLATEDPSEVRAYAEWAPSTGVTSFLATVVAADMEEGVRFMRAVAGAGRLYGANLLGINLEGPFLNPERKGAIPRSWIVEPDRVTLDRLWDASGGALKVMTVAPEMAGAAEVMQAALEKGVTVSVGHTDATYDRAIEAFRAGASHVTHAFNAMRPFHHREPGPVGAALDADGVTVEVIADGVHLHPSAVRMLARSVGAGRIVLVTDATPLAGRGEGAFQIGGAKAEVRGGRATLEDGTIAGSVATMDGIMRNVIAWDACSLADAVRSASTVPAQVAGIADRKGRLEPGYDADIVAVDADLNVAVAWTGGEPVIDVRKR